MDGGEAGQLPGLGGGGAPPSVVTGAGCTGRSAPSRRGCGAQPSARGDQSAAFPSPETFLSAVGKVQTMPPFGCLCTILTSSQKNARKNDCLDLPLCGESSQGQDETIGRN